MHKTCMKMKMRDPLRSAIIPLSLLMEMTNLLCSQHQKKEPAEEKRDPATNDGDVAPLVPPRPPPAAPVRRKKGPPIWQDPTATLEQEVSGDSRERAEDASILGRNADSEALRNMINKLSEERNLRTFA